MTFIPSKIKYNIGRSDNTYTYNFRNDSLSPYSTKKCTPAWHVLKTMFLSII